MKTYRTFKAILLLSITVILFSCSNEKQRHIGEWKGTDKGQTGTLILDKTNHAVMVVGNRVIGGNEFEIDSTKLECKYEIDYSKDPIWLDIIIAEKGKPEKGRLKGIIRFITNDKIEYRRNIGAGDRFDNFDTMDKENTLVMERVKK